MGFINQLIPGGAHIVDVCFPVNVCDFPADHVGIPEGQNGDVPLFDSQCSIHQSNTGCPGK